MRVTAAELTQLARDIFDRRRALLTLVGPVEEGQVAKLEKVLGRPQGSTVWLNEAEAQKRRRA
jgi:hypothetical protein